MRRTLLSFACACLLACPGGDDSSETGASTAEDTGSGTSSASGTSDPETSAPDDTTAMGSSGPPGDGTTAAGTTPIDACTAACEHLLSCDAAQVPNCGIPCAGVMGTSAGCEDEYVAQQECVSALSCEDAQAWVDAMGVGSQHPCGAEDQALQACMG